MKTKPLSIVTVNLNNREGLRRTVESVFQLEVQEFEYIIADGASDDGSLDIVDKYSDRIDCCISQPDRGIYDAMNNAAKVANGDYILFLNSGDYFSSPQVLNDINLEAGEDLVYGNHTYIEPVSGRQGLTKYDGVLDLEFFWRTTIPQCSTFIRKSCLNAGGGFDEHYPIAADWVFFCKAILERGCSSRHLDRTISIFELGGISTCQENAKIVKDERERFMRSWLPDHVIDYLAANESLKAEMMELSRELSALQHEHGELNRKQMKFRAAQLVQRIRRRLHRAQSNIFPYKQK